MPLNNVMYTNNQHCLDINYRTEIELKTISSYLFVFMVLTSFFFYQINHFMTSEIRYLHMKIAMLNDNISDKSSCEDDSEAETASASGSGSDSASASGSEDESSSSAEEPELTHNIRFRGRRYVMS
jgi:hypothetical protein